MTPCITSRTTRDNIHCQHYKHDTTQARPVSSTSRSFTASTSRFINITRPHKHANQHEHHIPLHTTSAANIRVQNYQRLKPSSSASTANIILTRSALSTLPASHPHLFPTLAVPHPYTQHVFQHNQHHTLTLDKPQAFLP